MIKTVVHISISVLYAHRPHVTHTHTHVSFLHSQTHYMPYALLPVLSCPLIRTIFPVIHLKSSDCISGESRILFHPMLSIISRKYSKEQNCINRNKRSKTLHLIH